MIKQLGLIAIVLTMVLVAACASDDESDSIESDPSSPVVASPSATDMLSSLQSDLPTPDPEFLVADFSLTGTDGEIHTLSEYRGQWVIINFWATWCEPCVAEIPFLNIIAETYSEDLVIIGINMRETVEEISTFRETVVELNYPVLIEPTDAILQEYAVQALPRTAIINPQGEWVWAAFRELDADSFPVELDAFINNDA